MYSVSCEELGTRLDFVLAHCQKVQVLSHFMHVELGVFCAAAFTVVAISNLCSV